MLLFRRLVAEISTLLFRFGVAFSEVNIINCLVDAGELNDEELDLLELLEVMDVVDESDDFCLPLLVGMLWLLLLLLLLLPPSLPSLVFVFTGT